MSHRFAITALADINVEAKAFVQPLGSEDAWDELGEGRFELLGHHLRVVSYDVGPGTTATTGSDRGSQDPGDNPKTCGLPTDQPSVSDSVGVDPPTTTGTLNTGAPPPAELDIAVHMDDGAAQTRHRGEPDQAAPLVLPMNISPNVLVEDDITNETPFVAKDGCLVWNSPPQKRSICVMFFSELGFQSAWSALRAAQQNPYPPLHVNVFLPKTSSPAPEDGSVPAVDVSNRETEISVNSPEAQKERIQSVLHPTSLLWYSFVERHCIACSIMENDLGQSMPALLEDPACCMALLRLLHPDLLEYLVSDEVYARFVSGMGYEGPVPQRWVCPDGLNPQQSMDHVINASLRIHHLRNEVLPLSVDDDVAALLDGLQLRLQNELVCSFISDEGLLKGAVDVLQRPRSADPSKAQLEEEAVCVQLKFITNLFSLTSSAFAKELVPHVISKVFSVGLLSALADLCTHYLTPSALGLGTTDGPLPTPKRGDTAGSLATIASLNDLTESFGKPSSAPTRDIAPLTPHLEEPISLVVDNGDAPLRQEVIAPSDLIRGGALEEPQGMHPRAGRRTSSGRGRRDNRPTSCGASTIRRGRPPFVMPANIERELSRLFEESLNRMNERGEERTVCEVFRNAISGDAGGRYRALMQFFLRTQAQAVTTGVSISGNRLLLFHLLGLHDDEGSGVDRKGDADAAQAKDAFHFYFITKVLPDALRGPTPAPTPPTTKQSQWHVPTITQSTDLLSPGLIRLLEYLYRVAAPQNRRELSGVVFSSASALLSYLTKGLPASPFPLPSASGTPPPGPLQSRDPPSAIPHPTTGGIQPIRCSLRKDALLQNLRFLRTVFEQAADDALVRKALLMEKDVLYSYLRLADLNGERLSAGMLRSSMLSLLQVLLKSDHLRDVRQALALRHRALLPAAFSQWCDQEALLALELKLQGASAQETEQGLHILSQSRCSTPHVSASVIEASHRKDRCKIDETDWRAHGTYHTLDDVSSFPAKLRSMIGSLSPTPPNSPSPVAEATTTSPDDAAPKEGAIPLVGAAHDTGERRKLDSGCSSPRTAVTVKAGGGGTGGCSNGRVVAQSPYAKKSLGGQSRSPKTTSIALDSPSAGPGTELLKSTGRGVEQSGPRPTPPKKKPQAPGIARRIGSGGRRGSFGATV